MAGRCGGRRSGSRCRTPPPVRTERLIVKLRVARRLGPAMDRVIGSENPDTLLTVCNERGQKVVGYGPS